MCFGGNEPKRTKKPQIKTFAKTTPKHIITTGSATTAHATAKGLILNNDQDDYTSMRQKLRIPRPSKKKKDTQNNMSKTGLVVK